MSPRPLVICALVAGGVCFRPGAEAILQRPHLPTAAYESVFHCARATMGRDSPYRMPLAGPETDPRLAAELAVLPAEARRNAPGFFVLEPLCWRACSTSAPERERSRLRRRR